MTDIPDLGPNFIVIPVADLPAVTEDDAGFMSVDGLDHMDFVGGPIGMRKPGRSMWEHNQNPRNEYARAVAHLAFMRHIEADPDEAARVFRLAKTVADCEDDSAWWALKQSKRSKFMRQARLADRAARQAVSA